MRLEEAVSLMQRDTRHLAKRQLTWFRADKEIRWFHPERERRVILEVAREFFIRNSFEQELPVRLDREAKGKNNP